MVTSPLALPVGGSNRDWRGSGMGAEGLDATGRPARWFWVYATSFGRTDMHGTILEKKLADMNATAATAQSERHVFATAWSECHEPPIAGVTEGSRLVEVAYGWPFRLYVGRVYFAATPITGTATSQAYSITPWRKNSSWNARGFMLTAVWGLPIGAGGALGISWAWRAGVTRRRLRLGRCTGCGYPLGRLAACPECGLPAGLRKSESFGGK